MIRFCGTCGSRLMAESNPQAVSIRPGTLDDTSWVTPMAQFWKPSARPWALIDGVHAEDGNPEDMRTLMRRFRDEGPVFVTS